MITIKDFWTDPYKSVSQARVTSVQNAEIELDRTIFFAFSGGQESDTGTIGEYPVLKAERRSRSIVYTLPQEHTLKVGDEVNIKIDWVRRYCLMRLHFAAELVLEIIYQKFPATAKVGAHIAQEKARIDFEWPGNISEIFPAIQSEFQRVIDLSQPILSKFSNEENERRFWKIEGFSEVPCGGTHLRNTQEVGRIKLKRVNPGKGKERIEIFLDS